MMCSLLSRASVLLLSPSSSLAPMSLMSSWTGIPSRPDFPISVKTSRSSLDRVSSPTQSEHGSRSYWRCQELGFQSVWPNYKHHLTHSRHYHTPHTYGVQKMSRLRCVDNSVLGRAAMSEGRPPKVIQVYSPKHAKKPHGAYGKLGDRVLCAVKGEKVQGIVVGLKVEQVMGVPRFDSNNVVLLHPNGNPLGTRIHAPIPNCIRPMLKAMSHPKKADYTKLIAIATTFV